MKYLVVGLEEIKLLDKEILAVALHTTEGVVGLGMHPEFVSGLSVALLQALGKGASDGTLKPELLPSLLPVTELIATDSGLEFSMGTSTGLQFDTKMPWSVARELGEKILRLCDHHESQAKPN